MPFQSRALNVAWPLFGESGMKPDVTSTQGPNTITPRSVLFIRLGWENTKVLIFISIETKISKCCFKIVSSSSLESKNVQLRFDNSKINQNTTGNTQRPAKCCITENNIRRAMRWAAVWRLGIGKPDRSRRWKQRNKQKEIPGKLKGRSKHSTEAVRLNGKLFYSCPFSPTVNSTRTLAMIFLLQE